MPMPKPSGAVEIVDVPFAYSATVRHARKRDFVTSAFRGIARVAVRIVDPEDAAVAAVVGNHGGNAVLESQRHALPYRLVGDDWYFPVVEPKMLRPISPDDLKDRLAPPAPGLARFTSQRNPFGPAASRGGAPNRGVWSLPVVEESGVKEVRSSRAADIRAAIERDAAEMIFVDGVLYRRCPPPRIEVRMVDGRPRLEFVPDTYSNDLETLAERELADPPLAAFPLDRIEEATTYAGNVAEKGAPPPKPPPVEIVRRDLLSRITLAEMVRAAAVAVDLSVRSVLPFLPRSGLMAYADMREAASAVRRREDPEADAAAFVSAYESVVAAVRRIEPSDTDGESAEAVEEALRSADVHLPRWRSAGGAGLAPEDDGAVAALR
jgi:hypothetical protein